MHAVIQSLDYGPRISSGRISPRVIHIGSMTLFMEDVNHAPPSTDTIQVERSVVENHYAAIMSELSSKSDEMKEMSLHQGLQQED